MIVSLKDGLRLFGVALVSCCLSFVCTLFFSYHADASAFGSVPAELSALFEAQMSMAVMVCVISGCGLGLIAAGVLIFYIKLFLDGHVKELGILKAMGYTYDYVYGLPEDEEVIEGIRSYAKVGAAVENTKSMIIGLAGPRQTWRVAGPQDMTKEEWDFTIKTGVTFVHIEMEEITDIADQIADADAQKTLDELKKKGLWFACADMDGETMYRLNLTGPIGLVIGSEGEGVSRLVKEKCDFVAGIPMKGEINSLNASVAGGILAYEVVRQRMER